jgi:glutamine synthetase
MDDPKTLGADPKAPRGDSGFRATGAESYSLDGIGEHAAFFSELYETCELQKIETDTLVHEAGLGQFELNTRHTDPLSGADQAFYFKRALRQVARRHGMVASFMAKPYPADYGNSMHIHQSLVNSRTGENLFADENDQDTPLFRSYIAGLQKYLPGVMPLLAPYPNSYLRIGTSHMSAPANTHWGYENRSVGLRVPFGGRESRRVENRVPGSDVNPYLALAATLACGYLGIEENLTPSKPLEGSAYDRKTRLLPRHFFSGLDAFERCTPIRRILGKEFVSLFLDIKNHEYNDEYQELSLWEKTFLLNQV